MMKILDRDAARRVVDGIWANEDEILESVVADGWSMEMARAGFERHRATWNVEELADSLEAEWAGIDESNYRIVWPRRVNHVWPALPGAGVTPVLVGVLLGIEQAVRPSSRGLNFARKFGSVSGVRMLGPDEKWEDADVVVVSGSEDTLDVIRGRVEPGGKVVGYGHRVSFAVVVDGGEVDLGELARGVAEDVVMWHQRGCFSVRAVLFCGEEERRGEFCEVLAQSIGEVEDRWGARDVGLAEEEVRAQALGKAQLFGKVYEDGVGYVRPVSDAFRGRREAIHSVRVHLVGGVSEVGEMIDVPARNIQGIAIGGAWRGEEEEWLEVLGKVGATRICGVGELQRPPAGWWHDGRANGLSWGRVVTLM